MDFTKEERDVIEQRLLARTIKIEGGCWECNYSGKKYPYMRIFGKKYRVNRIAYQLWRGEIINSLFVLHRCDNRKCVNPDHLWLGTNDENMKDMVKKGRQMRGDQHPFRKNPGSQKGDKNHAAKLTEEDVRLIRMWKNEGVSHKSIAKAFNIHPKYIYPIVTRKIWKHVE